MVDLETIATTPDAVVLTLGAVKFDPYEDNRETGYKEEIYMRFDIDTQQDDGRDVNDDTLAWWGRQQPAAFEEAFGDGDRIEFQDGIEKFRKFFWGSNCIWSHGSNFDVVILEHAMRAYKTPIPWKFWNVRDTRTLFDLGQSHDMGKEDLHHALADAKRQVIAVQNVYRKLGLTK